MRASFATKMCRAVELCEGVSKDSYNQHFKFQFASVEQVITVARHALSQAGIAFIIEFLGHNQGHKTGVFETHWAIDLIDSESGYQRRIVFRSDVQETSDKMVSKGLAGALKYFLRGNLLIPFDNEDDPDASGPSDGAARDQSGRRPRPAAQAGREAPPRPYQQAPASSHGYGGSGGQGGPAPAPQASTPARPASAGAGDTMDLLSTKLPRYADKGSIDGQAWVALKRVAYNLADHLGQKQHEKLLGMVTEMPSGGEAVIQWLYAMADVAYQEWGGIDGLADLTDAAFPGQDVDGVRRQLFCTGAVTPERMVMALVQASQASQDGGQ